LKCSNCGRDALIKVKWRGKNYCENHFKNYFLGQIRKVIDKYGVKGRIAIAVSGGKDSAAMLEALTKFKGMELAPFHLNLGIDGYSEMLEGVARDLTETLDLPLEVIDLKREYGRSLPELIRRRKGTPCSICGTVKRYLMNKYAYENGADYLATGHNLSDMVTFGLNNLINVQLEFLRGIKPVLPADPEIKLVSKFRPLYYLRDQETHLYVMINKIPFYQYKCPLSTGAPTLRLKSWIMDLEDYNPKALLNLIKSFSKIGDSIELKEGEIGRCELCGFATSTTYCRFCRLMG